MTNDVPPRPDAAPDAAGAEPAIHEPAIHEPAIHTGPELLDAEAVGRTLARIAHEVIERNEDLSRLALVGIHRRGVPLAQRLQTLIAERAGIPPALGALDITFHRDDVALRAGVTPKLAQPVVHGTELDFPIEGRTCVLVDDVLYSGRTIRAAIDALMEFGRPARVQLAVLIDRGHRELPIRPDYVGKNVPTSTDERVYVRLQEIDGIDAVVLSRAESTNG